MQFATKFHEHTYADSQKNSRLKLSRAMAPFGLENEKWLVLKILFKCTWNL